jgi:hypothetical protein
MEMYKVRVEARMDILGEVVDRFNVDVDQYTTKKEAKEIAEHLTYQDNERCHKYGLPIHFRAINCSEWK